MDEGALSGAAAQSPATPEGRQGGLTAGSAAAQGERLFGALPDRVEIYEVGPRDGLQNEPSVLPTEAKIAMIERAVDAGIRRIEITSFVNPRWIPALADHAEVAARIRRKPGVRYSALVPNMRGLDAASRSGMDEIAVFMAASETHNLKNINKTTADALATYAEVAREAHARGMRVRGYVSTVYGCPYEGTVPFDQVLSVARGMLDMGVYELSLGDTIGVGTPRQVAWILASLMEQGIGTDRLAVHFHDTRGTALANVTTALMLGVRVVDSALGGLGGCPYAPGASGNVATEDVVYMLDGMGIETGVDLARLVPVTVDLQSQLGRELPSKYLKAHIGHCARVGVPV